MKGIGQPTKAKRKLALLEKISLVVAEAEAINVAFERVLGHICTFMGWPLGHVYIWSEVDDALVSSRIWYMADASTIAPFRLLSEGTQFKRGEGTLGRVWESGEAIFILDVTQEDIFVRQMPVGEGGISAYFAFPVLVNGQVTAVLEFFSPETTAPDQDITSIITHVSSLLGLAWQREATVTTLRGSEAKLADLVLQLSALMKIGQSVAVTRELDLIYDEMLRSVRPLIGAEIVLLLLNSGDALEIVAIDHDNIAELKGMRIPLDSGIVGSVWASGQSLLLRGEACLKRLSQKLVAATNYEPEAVITVPVTWQDKTIGILQGAHREADAFDGADLQLLESAGVWTAIAIGNARQYNQLQQRLGESEAILSISNALIEVYDLEELLQLIVDRTQDIIKDADWTTIHLLHPKTRQLRLAASAGLEIRQDDYLVNSGEGIAGIVIAEGEVINVPDLQKDSRRLPIDLSTQARSLLAAPVETQRERIGTISVQCAEPNTFTVDDERLLTIFGVQAGMAIENVRLYTVQKRERQRADKQKIRMQQMARRVVQAQEEERVRIARELHDESGQSLTSLKISLDLIRSMLPDEMAAIKDSLTDVMNLTDKTMTNLRLVSHNLRPPGLDAYGLDAALSGLCQDFAIHTSLVVNYDGQALPDLASLSALSLYRFAQEAVTNAIKHAEATEVWMTLRAGSGMITLMVKDDGRGFEVPNLIESVPANGAGLLGMIERLEMVDGHLQVDSTLGGGSVLKAVVPYRREEI